MGCSSSFDAACKTDQFQEWLNQFEVMQLSRNEIRKLFYIFSAVDVDKSGQIALAELLAHIDLERTRFTERIFSIFDEDGSGEIDFREFVLSLWNYCTLTKATLGTCKIRIIQFCIRCTLFQTVFVSSYDKHLIVTHHISHCRHVRLRPVRQGRQRRAVREGGDVHAARHLRQEGVQDQLPRQDVSATLLYISCDCFIFV